MDDWKTIDSAPEDVLVLTRIADAKGVRNVQYMKRIGKLWYSGGMYVYYTPTHWKPWGEAK